MQFRLQSVGNPRIICLHTIPKLLGSTPLYESIAANMLVKSNGPRLTKACVRQMGCHKIKSHAVWQYSPSVVTNNSIYHEFCSLILDFVLMRTATNLSQHFSWRERKRYCLSNLVKNLLHRNKWTKLRSKAITYCIYVSMVRIKDILNKKM